MKTAVLKLSDKVPSASINCQLPTTIYQPPMQDWLDLNPDPAHVKRERTKARELRATDWWRAQLAKGECHYCHRKVGAENLTMDHVIPVARGGRSTRGNCVPCCRECNASKSAYTPAELIMMRLDDV